MAGIGFELRHMLRKNTLLGLLQAYTYASVIGSGPWVLSIVGILLIGIFSASVVVPATLVTQFQTSVTSLVACSLIYTGLAQLAFTRFVSDRMFERRKHAILPNLHGLMALVLLGAGGLGTLALFSSCPARGCCTACSCWPGSSCCRGVWILTVLLSGMKRYKAIVALFALSYGLIVVSALLLRRLGAGGAAGRLRAGPLRAAGRHVAADRARVPPGAAHDGLRLPAGGQALPRAGGGGLSLEPGHLGRQVHVLVLHAHFAAHHRPSAGLADLRPAGVPVLPVDHPGMAVFLVRIETDFVEYYDKFYDAVRDGGSLEYIEAMRDEMVYAIQPGPGRDRQDPDPGGTRHLCRRALASWTSIGISRLYLPLLQVQVIGAGLQVGLMAVLNVFFYLDQRRIVLWLCVQFVLLNVVLTGLSLWFGAALYGYGFALATLLTLATGLLLLSRKLDRLEYQTFMLQ